MGWRRWQRGGSAAQAVREPPVSRLAVLSSPSRSYAQHVSRPPQARVQASGAHLQHLLLRHPHQPLSPRLQLAFQPIQPRLWARGTGSSSGGDRWQVEVGRSRLLHQGGLECGAAQAHLLHGVACACCRGAALQQLLQTAQQAQRIRHSPLRHCTGAPRGRSGAVRCSAAVRGRQARTARGRGSGHMRLHHATAHGTGGASHRSRGHPPATSASSKHSSHLAPSPDWHHTASSPAPGASACCTPAAALPCTACRCERATAADTSRSPSTTSPMLQAGEGRGAGAGQPRGALSLQAGGERVVAAGGWAAQQAQHTAKDSQTLSSPASPPSLGQQGTQPLDLAL